MKEKRKGKTAENKQSNQELERLRILGDAIDEEVYVTDPKTYEILFVNRKMKENFGSRIEGKKCYKVFQGSDKPCSFCNIEQTFGKNLGKTYRRELQNPKNKRWYKCMGRAIRWSGNKYVRYGLAIDITEQKRMEDALRESEDFFRSIVENSHDSILIIDDNFRIVYANDETVRITGYPKDEIVGQDFRKFLDEENRTLVQERYSLRVKGEKVPCKYEFRVIRKDGEKRDIWATATLTQTRSGKRRVIAQLLDVTESKRMEKERNRFEERLSALNIHGQELSMAKDMEEIHKLTLDAMEKSLGFEYANILMVKGKMLCLASHRGYSKKLVVKLPLDKSRGITIRAVTTGEAVSVADVSKDEAYVEGGEGIRSELAVPIKVDHKVLGVLNVESKKIAAFNEEDRKLLEILASHAAISMSNLKARDKLKRISDELEHLMKSGIELMHVKDMYSRLKVIAEATRKFGWRRVVISLTDENLEAIETVTAGLAKEEYKLLLERRAPGRFWKDRLGPEFKRFGIGEFYYMPWNSQWVRENFHGVPRGTQAAETTKFGIPSRLSKKEMNDWHPQDILYAPLRTPENRIVGIISMDDPVDGKRPNREELAPLELFLHKAAITIENAQLIDSLSKARLQLEVYAEQLEQKVDDRTRELKKSQGQLLKAQRLAVIGELAGMVGHDLRNPLTSIAGAAYYVKTRLGGKINGKIMEMLELIENNIEYSNKIINDLLEYSREIQLELSEKSPRSMIEDALALVKIPKNVEVANLTENKPKMNVDADKIKRSFINIIKNALDAMPEGGRLTIRSERTGDKLSFVFTDTGKGMSKETVKKLWTPLFTTKAKGMGFGLPICKRIVEAHGGSITLESRVGKGTTFKVTIPIKVKTEKGGGEIWIETAESSLLTTTKT
jgi:PAS domain S-box-containing protein